MLGAPGSGAPGSGRLPSSGRQPSLGQTAASDWAGGSGSPGNFAPATGGHDQGQCRYPDGRHPMQHLTHPVRNIHPCSVWPASLRPALTVRNGGLTLVDGPLADHSG